MPYGLKRTASNDQHPTSRPQRDDPSTNPSPNHDAPRFTTRSRAPDLRIHPRQPQPHRRKPHNPPPKTRRRRLPTNHKRVPQQQTTNMDPSHRHRSKSLRRLLRQPPKSPKPKPHNQQRLNNPPAHPNNHPCTTQPRVVTIVRKRHGGGIVTIVREQHGGGIRRGRSRTARGGAAKEAKRPSQSDGLSQNPPSAPTTLSFNQNRLQLRTHPLSRSAGEGQGEGDQGEREGPEHPNPAQSPDSATTKSPESPSNPKNPDSDKNAGTPETDEIRRHQS